MKPALFLLVLVIKNCNSEIVKRFINEQNNTDDSFQVNLSAGYGVHPENVTLLPSPVYKFQERNSEENVTLSSSFSRPINDQLPESSQNVQQTLPSPVYQVYEKTPEIQEKKFNVQKKQKRVRHKNVEPKPTTPSNQQNDLEGKETIRQTTKVPPQTKLPHGTKIVEVLRVPAMYELHLQADPQRMVSLNTAILNKLMHQNQIRRPYSQPVTTRQPFQQPQQSFQQPQQPFQQAQQPVPQQTQPQNQQVAASTHSYQRLGNSYQNLKKHHSHKLIGLNQQSSPFSNHQKYPYSGSLSPSYGSFKSYSKPHNFQNSYGNYQNSLSFGGSSGLQNSLSLGGNSGLQNSLSFGGNSGLGSGSSANPVNSISSWNANSVNSFNALSSLNSLNSLKKPSFEVTTPKPLVYQSNEIPSDFYQKPQALHEVPAPVLGKQTYKSTYPKIQTTSEPALIYGKPVDPPLQPTPPSIPSFWDLNPEIKQTLQPSFQYNKGQVDSVPNYFQQQQQQNGLRGLGDSYQFQNQQQQPQQNSLKGLGDSYQFQNQQQQPQQNGLKGLNDGYPYQQQSDLKGMNDGYQYQNQPQQNQYMKQNIFDNPNYQGYKHVQNYYNDAIGDYLDQSLPNVNGGVSTYMSDDGTLTVSNFHHHPKFYKPPSEYEIPVHENTGEVPENEFSNNENNLFQEYNEGQEGNMENQDFGNNADLSNLLLATARSSNEEDVPEKYSPKNVFRKKYFPKKAHTRPPMDYIFYIKEKYYK